MSKSNGHAKNTAACGVNIEAEKSVLGCIFLRNEAYHWAQDLCVDDFSLDSHQRIYRAMTELAEDGTPINFVTVGDAVGDEAKIGGASYLCSLTDGLPKSTDILHYVKILKKRSSERKLRALLETSQSNLEQGTDTREVLLNIEQSITKIRVESSARKPLEFKTAKQICEEVPAKIDWIVEGFVALAITQLIGKVKAAGKTTFAMHMMKAILSGQKFIGRATTKTPIVYLSEMPELPLGQALRAAGLLDHGDLFVLRYDQIMGRAWPEIIDEAIAKAKEIGAGLLVVDTFPQFAGLVGDSENDAGSALEAMQPLQRAVAQGLAVLAVIHERKSGGDVSDAGRGSSASAGAADILVTLRRMDGKHPPTYRKLESWSRLGPSESLIIDLTDYGYMARGSSDDVAAAEAKKKLLALLPNSEGDAMPENKLVEETECSRSTIKRLLKTLPGIVVIGEGKKNDPRRYYFTAKETI